MHRGARGVNSMGENRETPKTPSTAGGEGRPAVRHRLHSDSDWGIQARLQCLSTPETRLRKGAQCAGTAWQCDCAAHL
jgi:hypothetical protein